VQVDIDQNHLVCKHCSDNVSWAETISCLPVLNFKTISPSSLICLTSQRIPRIQSCHVLLLYRSAKPDIVMYNKIRTVNHIDPQGSWTFAARPPHPAAVCACMCGASVGIVIRSHVMKQYKTWGRLRAERGRGVPAVGCYTCSGADIHGLNKVAVDCWLELEDRLALAAVACVDVEAATVAAVVWLGVIYRNAVVLPVDERLQERGVRWLHRAAAAQAQPAHRRRYMGAQFEEESVHRNRVIMLPKTCSQQGASRMHDVRDCVGYGVRLLVRESSNGWLAAWTCI